MRSKLPFLFLALSLVTPGILLADDHHGGRTSRSPLMVAEVNNNGDVRVLLTVYDDGEAILARKDTDEPDGEICTANVPAAYLEALEDTLRSAGALHLDDAEAVPNLTRKTISFFVGPDHSARTRGNTFSYSRAEGPYLIVAQAVSAVITDHFGGCI
jgi:hypothetical protein